MALVDTGWPSETSWDGLVAGLNKAGWDLSDLKAVLITHGHGDHMGLARRLRERTGAWVAMHEADTHTEDMYASHQDFLFANNEALRKRGGQAADFEAAAARASRLRRTTSPRSACSRTVSWWTAGGHWGQARASSRCTRRATPRATSASSTMTATCY